MNDWWGPLGEAGRLEVHEPMAPADLQRLLARSADTEIRLGHTDLRGQRLEFVARGRARRVRLGAETVALLDLSGPADLTAAFHRPITVLGETGEAVRHEDDERGSRLRGALRYLRISIADRVWVWHYAGGRTAGERLVLGRGDTPSDAAPIVTTYPSARGRALGNPKGGATAETHVTSWAPGAAAAEVLLVELLASTWVGRVVDYRPTRIAEGVSELLGVAPRPDANTT